MNNYIKLFNQLSKKKWIFPCRLFIPSDFGIKTSFGHVNTDFYIDFVSDVSIKYQTVYFKGYLAIGLKNDNGYLTSAIQLIESEPIIFFSSTKGNTQYNGKYITWRDDAQSSPQLFFCDYKDIPRILYREILPQFPCFKGNMEKVAKDIIDKAKKSMLYAQSVRQITLPSRDCFIK